ncbi:hypothetical protein N234_15375 [Ralstonia pickettii DTP0602]|nr:hypothetical protein N234_15375 [Ralstonia pickettii DTP0602]
MPASGPPALAVYWNHVDSLASPKPRDTAVDGARNIPMTGRQTMVTKKEEAFVLKNLLALAAVETLGGAIALGMVFHLI